MAIEVEPFADLEVDGGRVLVDRDPVRAASELDPRPAKDERAGGRSSSNSSSASIRPWIAT